MSRLLNLDNILVHSKKKTFLKYNNLKNCFETEDKNRFNVINGIPDFFEGDSEKLSLIQSKFYNEIKFPNYDEIDDFGTLLDKSERSTFFKKLDQEIKMFSKVLEVGCGTGFVLEGISKAFPSVDLYGADYFEEGLVHARQRIPKAVFRQLDAKLLEDKDLYDAIGAFDAIEHIDHDGVVLKNLARALRSRGSLIITVPQHQWLWSSVDVIAGHVRRYSRQELEEKVQSTGLKVEYVTSFVSLLVPFMWLARLGATENSYDPLREFKIPRWLNKTLEGIMHVEFFLLKTITRNSKKKNN